jgi:alpha-galactosidase
LLANVTVATSAAAVPVPARLPGLDREARYTVEPVDTGGSPFTVQRASPRWWPVDGEAAPVLPGSFLADVGLPMPVLGPEQAVVLHLRRD